MDADWKAALAALNLPEAPADDTPAETLGRTDNPRTKHPALNIYYERKGRKGKEATIIGEFKLPDSEVDEIASQLKRKMGVGGSARGGEILIQGDRRNDAARLLRDMGFKVK